MSFILHNNRILQGKSMDYELIDDFPVYESHTSKTYSRPADWLSLPTVSEGEQKIHMLVAVYENLTNWLAFTVAGSYSVDWGDGTVTGAVASNTTSRYDIKWSGVSSGTLTERGYRQSIVTISAATGSSLTSFNLKISPSPNFNAPNLAGGSSSYQNSVGNNVLDIRMVGASFSSIAIGDDYAGISNPYVSTSYCNMLEQFEFVGTNSVTNFSAMFRSLKNLRKVSQLYTGQGTNMSQMFFNCNRLVELPQALDTQNVTNMQGMFGQCTNINNIPGMTTSNVTNMEMMFIRCHALDVAPYFDTTNVTNMRFMFSHCYALSMFEGWNFLSYPIPSVYYNTQNVTNMDGMFWRCHSLQTIPQFNTTNVATMSYMFFQCSSLQSIPGLTTSNVKTMRGMFYQCRSLINDTRMTGVPYMDTSSVTDMKEMFLQCYRVKTIPQFNTQNVTDMSLMFYDCIGLQEVPLLNTATCSSMYMMFTQCYRLETIPQFNTQNVKTMARMFYDCYNLREIPLLDTGSVQNMTEMFYQSTQRGRLRTIPQLNTSNVRSMYMMFKNCRSLVSIPELNTSNVRTAFHMFTYCINLREVSMGLTALGLGASSDMSGIIGPTWSGQTVYSGPPSANSVLSATSETTIQPYYSYEPNYNTSGNGRSIPQANTFVSSGQVAYPVSNVNVSNVLFSTNVKEMFYQCYNLRKVNLNLPTATDASYMFYECSNLRKGLSMSFSGSLTNTAHMFRGCYNLKSSPSFQTSGVTDMSYMFYQCYELIDVATYSTGAAVNMSYMFYNQDNNGSSRGNLKVVPQFNTPNVTNMSYMFAGCRILNTVPLLDTTKVTTIDAMFNGCIDLKYIPKFNFPALTSLYIAFQNCFSLEYVPSVFTYSNVSMYMRQAFQNCTSLRYLDSPFNSKVNSTYWNSAGSLYATFDGCVLLERIPQMDVTNCVDYRYAFRNCYNLVEFPGLTMSNITPGSYPSLYGDGYNFNYLMNSGMVKLARTQLNNFNFTIVFNGLSLEYSKIVEIFNKAGTVYGASQSLVAWTFYGSGNNNGGSSRVIDIRRNPGTSQLTYVDRKIAYDKWWVLPGYGYVYSRDNVYNENASSWTHPITSQAQSSYYGIRPYGMFWRFVNSSFPYDVYKNALNNASGEYSVYNIPEPANTDKHSIDNGAPSNRILDFYNTRVYDYWMWRYGATSSDSGKANFLAAGMHALTHSVYDGGNQHKYDLTTYVNEIYTQPTIMFATASYRTTGAIYDLKIGKNWFRQSKGPNASPVSNVWFKFNPTYSGTASFAVWTGPSSSNVVYGSQRRSQIALWETDGITERASAGWSYSSSNPFALSGVFTYSVDNMPATASCYVTASNWYYISVDVADDGYQGNFTLANWWII